MTRSSGNGYIYKVGWRQLRPSCRLPVPDLPINPDRSCSATIR